MLQLKLYGQVIELEKECEWCDGRGTQFSGQSEPCEMCGGTGRIPTENGETILDFVRRYLYSGIHSEED